MSVKWYRGAAEKRRKKRIREKPRPPHVPKPSVKKVFRGPRQPGVRPQDLVVERPFIHAEDCGCGMHRSSEVTRRDYSASALNDLVNKAELNGFPREDCTVWWEAPGGRRCSVKMADQRGICQHYAESIPEGNPMPFPIFARKIVESCSDKGMEPQITGMTHPNCTCVLHVRFVHGSDPARYYEFAVSAAGTLPGIDKSVEFKSSSDEGADDFPAVQSPEIEEAVSLARESPEDCIVQERHFNVFKRSEWDQVRDDIVKRLETQTPDEVLDAYEGPISASHVERQRKNCEDAVMNGRSPNRDDMLNKILFRAQSVMIELSQEPGYEWIGGAFRFRDYGIPIPELPAAPAEEAGEEEPEEAAPAEAGPEVAT